MEGVAANVPLNSNTTRDNAVIVALIMWGEVPASPAAIILRYSSTSAVAAVKY